MALLNSSGMMIGVDISTEVKIREFVEVDLYDKIIEAGGTIVDVEVLKGVGHLVIMVYGPQFRDQVRNSYQILCEHKGHPSIIKFAISQNIFDGLNRFLRP